MHDLTGSATARSNYVEFDEAKVAALSPIRTFSSPVRAKHVSEVENLAGPKVVPM